MRAKRLERLAVRNITFGLLVAGAAFAQQLSGTPPLAGLAPDHATLFVGDIQKESAWYEQVLGFTRSQSFVNDTGALFQMMTIPGYRIDLLEYTGSAKATYTYSRYMTQGWVHLVYNVPNITAAYKSLQDLKTDVVATKNAKGEVEHLILHDPEGNQFELFQRP